MVFGPVFTLPTFQNILVLFVGAVMSPRSRTITAILRASAPLATKHFTSFHRVLSKRKWNMLLASFILVTLIIGCIAGNTPIVCAVDDSTVRRWGKRVYGKGCHRDAVRSSKTKLIHCFGHKWVVFMILLPMPFSDRRWALPFMALLYQPKEQEIAERGRHFTSIDWARKGCAWLVRKFPARQFIILGDGGFSSLAFALWCSLHKAHITLVSRFYKNAVLHADPKPRQKGQKGPTPKKGERILSPEQEAKQPNANWKTINVKWYGAEPKKVKILSKKGLWYQAGNDPVPVRWVLVRFQDENKKREEECFFTTDVNMKPKQIVEHYVSRWNIEVTFEEVRAHLGLETLRNYCENSVKRSIPALLAVFSIIALWFHKQWQLNPPKIQKTPWYKKEEPTFSDALIAIRLDLFHHTFLSNPALRVGYHLIPKPLKEFLIQKIIQIA